VFGSENEGLNGGVPDGMKIDLKGNLYVVGPRGIWVWDREGRHLGTIVMPEQPANLAWGGPDYGTLYISATTSVYRIRTSTRGFVPYLAYATPVSLSSGHSAGVSLEAKAFAAYREGRLNEARQWLELVIESDPHSARAHTLLGLTLARQNDLQHALLNFQQAYKINRGNPDFAYDYSVLLLEAGQFASALPILEGLHRRSPEANDILVNLARAYAATANSRKLSALIQKLPAADYVNQPLLEALATILAGAGQT
jgi:tetratricopeptide (TPR) repeat protein